MLKNIKQTILDTYKKPQALGTFGDMCFLKKNESMLSMYNFFGFLLDF